MKHKAIIALAILSCTACSSNKEDKEIEATALAFMQNYFECNYKEAYRQCTAESEKWITFVASNVNDSDLTVINAIETDASFEIKDIDRESDTTATVKTEANNYMKMSAITRKGEIAEKDTYSLNLKRRNGKWLVNLTAVPTAER